jgi:hypothetical protein
MRVRTGGGLNELTYLSGPDQLKQVAFDAVKKWIYQLALLEGKPVEVNATTSIAFTL